MGRSLWRKKIKDGARRGVKAKTIYPTKPDDWTDAWAPDSAWGLVKASLMVGKSIGFLTVKSRAPTEEEIKRKPELGRRPANRGGVDPARIRVLLAADESGGAGGGGVEEPAIGRTTLKFVGAELPAAGEEGGDAADSVHAALRDREGDRAGDRAGDASV